MERRYRKTAPKSSRESGTPGNELPLVFDRQGILRMLRDGLHSFAVEMGLVVAVGLLEDEVKLLCGERYERSAGREMSRYGHQNGRVRLAGQKVAVKRPRVRYTDGRGEVALPTYALLQQERNMSETVLRRLLHGVSCRNYEAVVDRAREGFGVKRSSVSREFMRTMAGRIKGINERRWDEIRFAVIYIDGVGYGGETMVVVMGITSKGHKHILGIRQGASENAEVCKDLLEELRERGVATEAATLFVLDGAKALRAAVKRVWGRYAVVQRCQVHKQRNIKSYLAKCYWPELERWLAEAYGETDYERAREILKDTTAWLERINPDAAASLREGLEETLTVVRLAVPAVLRKTLSNTNTLESAFSTGVAISRRVKRWRPGDMRWRWCAAGLLLAEQRFHRVRGYKQIPKLLAALDSVVAKEATARLDTESETA